MKILIIKCAKCGVIVGGSCLDPQLASEQSVGSLVISAANRGDNIEVIEDESAQMRPCLCPKLKSTPRTEGDA